MEGSGTTRSGSSSGAFDSGSGGSDPSPLDPASETPARLQKPRQGRDGQRLLGSAAVRRIDGGAGESGQGRQWRRAPAAEGELGAVADVEERR